MKDVHTGDAHVHAETLANALEIWGAQTRRDMMDRLGCYLHNEGNALANNTEKYDVIWLAKAMAVKSRGHAWNDWERMSEGEKKVHLEFAAIAISCLPELCERIARRYAHAAVAVRSMEQMTRANK